MTLMRPDALVGFGGKLLASSQTVKVPPASDKQCMLHFCSQMPWWGLAGTFWPAPRLSRLPCPRQLPAGHVLYHSSPDLHSHSQGACVILTLWQPA